MATNRQQATNWVFTLNNPTPEDEISLLDSLPYLYVVFQYESGEEGTIHMQGYVVLDKQLRLSGLKKIHSRIHWEVRRGTHQQAKAYCMKSETRIDGPYQYGTEPQSKKGERSDLLLLKADIDAGAKMEFVAENHFGSFLRYEKGIRSYMDISSKDRVFENGETPKIEIYWGPSGTGKSHRAFTENPGAYRLNRPEKNADVLWGDYEGQETVIVDEFYSWIPYEKLLTWVDVHPGVKVRKLFGQVKLRAKKWIFTSNKDPATWYPNIDKHAWHRRLEDWGTIVHMTERFTRAQVPPQENFAVEGYISEEL